MKPYARILDVCCGSKMFHFDKESDDIIFMDIRALDTTLCDGRKLLISPDIIADFRDIPFEDEKFHMVIFDPPHLVSLGPSSWMALKYGVLGQSWREDLKHGFDECMRVLKPGGTLRFKWNETQISLNEVIKLFQVKPVILDRRQKTIWVSYIK